MSERFTRYVAIGDSSTEGVDDPDGAGGYRGWSRRLAARIAQTQGSLEYANLGVRGRHAREVRAEQLAPALALAPDLATVFVGTNDVLAARFDPSAFAADLEHMERSLRAAGAVVLTFTLPDLAPLIPFARLLSPRIAALNGATRAVSARTGTRLVDFARYPVATDVRLWSGDRIHANAAGHARIADALADALALPGASRAWQLPLAEPLPGGAAARLAGEWRWAREHLWPWVRNGLFRRETPRFPAREARLERVSPTS